MALGKSINIKLPVQILNIMNLKNSSTILIKHSQIILKKIPFTLNNK